jgi:hypothetical protein
MTRVARPRRPAAGGEDRAGAPGGDGTAGGGSAGTDAGARPAALRLATIHLRMGQHALARAELEAFAGRGLLDSPALLDLAEVRWRTGDLVGAADAANAVLADGREEPLALLIAAEAVSELGRPGEARRLAARVLARTHGPLDPLFAGMPRAMIWPDDAPLGPAEVEPAAPVPARRPRVRGVMAPPAGGSDPASAAAAEAFAGGRAALGSGDVVRAASELGVALRLEPGFADAVLDALAGRGAEPLLELVRGDALRLLGREAEALEAFDRARGGPPAPAAGGPAQVPGLFDEVEPGGDDGGT